MPRSLDRKSTRLNSSHRCISYAVFCLKKSTQPGYVLGTPYYMAPEQVRGEQLTGLVDVYAFGVLLFELLTGQKVFVADSVDRIFYSILNVPLDVAPLQSAGVPPPVIQLVTACNAKLAADRPRGFAPIIADLEHMIAGL